MKNYTLGIDMGVASIGWACISIEDRQIDSGVRIFPAGIDKFGSGKDTHLNQKRRKARTARRRCSRKAKRKQLIRNILSDLGWIPTKAQEIQQWENLDVYELRHRAIHSKITLPELGRLILHLNQRRGFLSLRKSDLHATEGEDKKQLEGMLGAISHLEKEIKTSGYRTLGNYLYHLRQKEGGQHGHAIRLRSRHIPRSMLHQEFSLIWETQSQYHSGLTDQLRYGTHGKRENPTAVTKPVQRDKSITLLEQFGFENLTFFQRRVYWPIDSIGHCELEKGELRAPVADRRFQEFRMLQELNNLRIFDQSALGKPTERKLTSVERATAITYLTTTQKPTLNGLKKKIAKLPDSPEESHITFNLEKNDRNNIGGLPTEIRLSKALGTTWKNLDEDFKNQIVEVLTLPESHHQKVIQRTDDETYELLENIPELKHEDIESLLPISLPLGYCSLSIKALEKLLPHMREGKLYQGKKGENHDSARHLAGYPRRDEVSSHTFDLLPHLQQVTNPNDTAHYDENFPHINNPLVLRALHELRKVVNAIIYKHGKPSAIHLEMARDLKMSGKQRDDYIKKTNQHKKERQAAAKELAKYGVAPTRDAITLYRLWEEQNKTCIYSGETIGIKQLLKGEVEIDHIYPRRANDDSYMNKVVCFARENREKGDRLPSEWLGEGSAKFEAISQRAQFLPYAKRKRLLDDKIPEDFADRDAVDTAYMSRAARHYLASLFDREHQVLCTKGRHTAFLRKHWQLNDLLRHDLLDLKNRDDHRHHALDAIVIALCGRSFLQKISRQLQHDNSWKTKTDKETGKDIRIYRLKPSINDLPAPWKEFRLNVTASLERIWVSHRPKRKISGPLHEETNYGATHQPGILVRRKRLSTLTNGEISKIRDESIKHIVRKYREQETILYPEDFGKKMPEELHEHFQSHDTLTKADIACLDDGRLKKDLTDKLKKKNPLKDAELDKITMLSGIPIKKVRLEIPNKAAVALRPNKNSKEFVIPGNTHHVAIFSLGDGKHHFEPVTMLEMARRMAVNRKRKRQNLPEIPLINRTPPDHLPEAEFRMHLCYNDSILADTDNGQELYIFKGVHAVQLTAKFVIHTDARKNNQKDPVTGKAVSIQKTTSPNKFDENFPNATKVTITPDGQLRLFL